MSATVFRLYPERGSLFVRAIVHPTKRAMRAHFDASPLSAHERFGRRLGYCREIRSLSIVRGRWRRDPCIAEVHLFRSRLGMEIVTHEIYHATMAWARRVRFPFVRLGADDSVTPEEERIAYVHGRLCRQFTARAYDAGLYS